MQGLYRKVIKGQFKPISKQYNQDLAGIVKSMLALNSEERPSCD